MTVYEYIRQSDWYSTAIPFGGIFFTWGIGDILSNPSTQKIRPPSTSLDRCVDIPASYGYRGCEDSAKSSQLLHLPSQGKWFSCEGASCVALPRRSGMLVEGCLEWSMCMALWLLYVELWQRSGPGCLYEGVALHLSANILPSTLPYWPDAPQPMAAYLKPGHHSWNNWSCLHQ